MIDYKTILLEMISEIRDKASYLKNIDKDNSSYNPVFYEGMAQAYTFVVNGIIDYINSIDDLQLEDVGLDDFNPNEIMEYIE